MYKYHLSCRSVAYVLNLTLTHTDNRYFKTKCCFGPSKIVNCFKSLWLLLWKMRTNFFKNLIIQPPLPIITKMNKFLKASHTNFMPTLDILFSTYVPYCDSIYEGVLKRWISSVAIKMLTHYCGLQRPKIK